MMLLWYKLFKKLHNSHLDISLYSATYKEKHKKSYFCSQIQFNKVYTPPPQKKKKKIFDYQVQNN